jgi:cytochrome P450
MSPGELQPSAGQLCKASPAKGSDRSEMALDVSGLPKIEMMFSDEAHARYAELRPARFAQSPNGFLSLLHYQDAHAVLCDRNLRPMSLEALEFIGVTDGPLREMFERLMFSHEGKDHQRLRRLVSSAFAPRTIELLRMTIRQTADQLLDDIVLKGQADLTEQFAKPLAIVTLCDLLGVPAEDIPRFQDWAAGMGLAFGSPNPETLPIIEEAAVGLSEYAEVLIERRRTVRTADIVSALVQAEEEGDRLTTAELVATVANLLFAGYDTTYRQITLGLLCLARNEPVRERLAADASLAGGVAEEVLRLEPIAHSTVRLAVADTSVNGVDLPCGTIVESWIASANRDPSVFQDPDRFDPGRQGSRALSFGQGIHSCLGAALARLELSEALAATADRLVGWDFEADPDSLNWYPLTEGFRGLVRLPVRAA